MRLLAITIILFAVNARAYTNYGVAAGDSITAGTGETNWVLKAGNLLGWGITNVAVAGYTTTNVESILTTRVFPNSKPASSWNLGNFVMFHIGGNDIYYGSSGNLVFMQLSNLCYRTGTNGQTNVFIGVPAPRNDIFSDGTKKTQFLAFSNLLVTQGASLPNVKKVINWSTNVLLDPFAHPENYQGDQLHPAEGGSDQLATNFALYFTPPATIGSAAALTTTSDQDYAANLPRLPASNSVQTLNPPVFLMPYYESPDLLASATVTRVFNFQLTTNGSFASPLISLTTSNIWYNFFPSITNSDGSTWSNTVSWRIRYLNSNATVASATSAVHTFTMPANATKWDRSDFANRTYLNTLSNLHPRILFKATNVNAMRALVNNGSSTWGGFVGTTFAELTNTLSILSAPEWTSDGATLTAQANFPYLAKNIGKLGGAYWMVTNAWFTNAINSASPSVGSVLTNWCIQAQIAAPSPATPGWDRYNAYEGNLYGISGLALAYDLFYPILTSAERAVCLRLLENWAAFYIYEGWYYYGSDTNLDRVYGGRNLTVQYPSGAIQDESHNRHDRAALVLCLAGMGDSPNLDYYAEWYLGYYMARFDPFQNFEDPRIYGGTSSMADYARAWYPWLWANTMFNDKGLTNAVVYRELADLYLFQTPIGYRSQLELWGPAESYQTLRVRNNYQYITFALQALMTGRGDLYRAHKRAVALGDGALVENDDKWFIDLAASYWAVPSETDRNTNSFIDPYRGWAVGMSAKPTDYGVATNGVTFAMQARPTGNGRSGGAFTDGSIEIGAYGAVVTAGGGGRYYSAALLGNGIFVDGIGVNNESPSIAISRHAYFDAYTNWGDGVYFRADLTHEMNLSNYAAQGTGNLQSFPGSSARHHYLQSSNARPYISSVKRSVLSPHNRYQVIYDAIATTQPAQFQNKWNVMPTNCTAIDLSTMSFNYSVTNTWTGRSNVTVYVQDFVSPTIMGVTQMVNAVNVVGTNEFCYAKMNPFSGENYAYTNDWIGMQSASGPSPMGIDFNDYYWANTFWHYNKTPTTNWHFLKVVYTRPVGCPAPTFTRLDDYTFRADIHTNDGAGNWVAVTDIISYDTNNIAGGSGAYAGMLTHLVDEGATNAPPEIPPAPAPPVNHIQLTSGITLRNGVTLR